MNKELPKVYEPQEVEGRVYAAWEENGCFRGIRDPEKKPFIIQRVSVQSGCVRQSL